MAKPIPNFITVHRNRVIVDYRGLRRVCSRCGQEGHIGPTCKIPRCDRNLFPAECHEEGLDLSVLRGFPPPPVIDPAPGSLEEIIPQDDPVSNISSNAAAMFGFPATNTDDLSSNSDRFVITDKKDVTTGKEQTASTLSHRESLPMCSSPTGPASAGDSAEDLLCDCPDVKRGLPPIYQQRLERPSTPPLPRRNAVDSMKSTPTIPICRLCPRCSRPWPWDVWNARELDRLIGIHHLLAAWVELHGTLYAPTWSRGLLSSRLDRFYVPCLMARLLRCAVLSFPGATGYVLDHRPVSSVFDVTSFLHSRGDTWRLDTVLLPDKIALSSVHYPIHTSLSLVNHFLKTGKVLSSFWCGWVALLPKDGSPSDPVAWRPITHLNADYKRVAFLFISSLRPVLPHVNRCLAVGQQRRTRAMMPRSSSLRGAFLRLRYFDAKLFWLGEREFLRRWFRRCVTLGNGDVSLSFVPLNVV
ncbi:hypothetical protein HPB47_023881 [Ixodes persulcatus]|uniref:Uncharacterized protein n=1 Tax=Ixodes persulcatus TaxID=34615 RepID=A0AC60Q5U8_IXOPE|nr:hypothetical protein HPB47_023881 [Ixodes persulcatus]